MAAIAGEATFERSMIDIRLARDDPDAVKAALGRRGVDAAEVDALLEADSRAPAAAGRRDEVRAKVNDLSRQVAEAKRAHDDASAGRLADESRALRDEESTLGA